MASPLVLGGFAVLVGLAAATDYYASPDPAGDDLSLEQCLRNLVHNDRCLLRSGHYYPSVGATDLVKTRSRPLENIEVIPADEGGEVLIDGTSELKDLTWKTCEEEDPSLSCAEGVWVARLNDATFTQLFFGGESAEEREMLVNARWPNAADPPPEATDAPAWAGIFDSYRSWSYPDGGRSGRVASPDDALNTKKRVPGAYGKFMDNGGNPMDEDVEVEAGQWETVTRLSPAGFLNNSGLSVKGANIVITYGKGGVEQGVVTEHTAGENYFEYEHPQCANGGYGSCAKGFWKSEFTSYFFENALPLLDREKEYYFERNDEVGSRLFLKARGGKKPSWRLWARHSDFFLNIDGSRNFTVRGIKTFATALTTKGNQPNPMFRLLDNTFLYPTSGKRLVGWYKGWNMYFHNAHGALFSNNVWRYAEGTALDAKGGTMTMEDNLFEYNGIYSTSGPETIKWSGGAGRIVHNTLRWNGQVTGWKLMGGGLVVTDNHIEHQNWGTTLHDGAGLHVQMSAGDSEYAYNWIHDGHHSLGIRFDTSKDTVFEKPEDVGHDGQVHHNVLWGKFTKIAMKGDRHNVTMNTVVGGSKIVLIRAFGVQQGMNELTVCDRNVLEANVSARGNKWSGRRRRTSPPWENEPDGETKEPRAKGDAWELTSRVQDNAVDEHTCWDGLLDCTHRDFRPRDGSGLEGKGAYENGAKAYRVPGRRTDAPAAAVPLDGAAGVSFESAALIFLPAKGCGSHRVALARLRGGAQEETTLTDGKNVWDVGALERGETYEWVVTPLADVVGCEAARPSSFKFTVATQKRTSTTTAPPETCFDDREVRQGTDGAAWCVDMVAQGKCHRPNVRKDCQKSCGVCFPSTAAPTTTPQATTPVPTTPRATTPAPTTTNSPPDDCVDDREVRQGAGGAAWCADKVALGKCHRPNVRNNCQKSCGVCVPSTAAPTTSPTTTSPQATTPAPTTPKSPPDECFDIKGAEWCEPRAAKGNCHRNNVKRYCQKTCGECQGLVQVGGVRAETAEPSRPRGSLRGFLHRGMIRASQLVQHSVGLVSSMLVLEEDKEGLEEQGDAASPEL